MPNKPPHIVFTQPLPTKGQYKVYSVATSESLGMIKGDNRKGYWEAFDNDGKFLESAERKKQLMDFFREIDKKSRMAGGGGIDNRILVVLDEGNGKVINDLYTQWNNVKSEKDQAEWYEKVKNTTFGTYGTISIKEVLEKFDFDKSEKINSVSKEDFKNELNQALKYAKGGGIGFEKLSNKVAKNYEGKKVAPKYQHEYGKTYSRAEAKEVGDKVAGKVYWQQQGRMATGGNIKKYEYSPSIEEQKTWDEKKTRIYDAYVNSYNTYQDLLEERKRAIGRNDKDEVKSIDLRLKNKLLAIRFAYSELKGRFYEEDFKDGGNLDSLDARISKAIFQAYGDIDDAIEFKFNDPDSGVAPYRLVFLAVQKGFITPEEINKDLLNSAYETSSETADAEEIGSSDMNHYVWSMLRDAGFDMKVENGTYIRVKNKMAEGGSVEIDVQETVQKIKSEYPRVEVSKTYGGSIQVVDTSVSTLQEINSKVFSGKGSIMKIGGKFSFAHGLYYPPIYKNGGTTDKMDEYIRKNRERQAKEEEGKYFSPFRAFVYEDSYQFADFKTDDFHKAVKWAKETLEAQRTYRKNTESMWAIVDEFTPIEERGNVIYPYKEVARFTEENTKEMKFGNGGNTTFYHDQAKKTLGEHLYNHIASLNKEQLEIHLSHLQKEIERMKANDTEFTKQEFLPKYKQEEKFILYLLERLDEFKYADGGNVEEDQEYYRVFRNNAGKDVAVKILKNPIFGKYDYYVDGSLRGQFDTFAQARAEVNYENFDMYKDGGNIYSKEESLQIARTILQQMGGQNRLVAFTGAYGFAYADGDVSFRIKNRKVNYVKVKLNGKDLYDVTFGRVSGTNFKVVEQLDDVYAEDLIDIFEKSTGMYLRFEKGGKMAKGGGVGKSFNYIADLDDNQKAVYKRLKSYEFNENNRYYTFYGRDIMGSKEYPNIIFISGIEDLYFTTLKDAEEYLLNKKYAKGGGIEEINQGDYFINTESKTKFYIVKIDREDKNYPFYVIKSNPNDLPEVISERDFQRYLKAGLFEKTKYATGGGIEDIKVGDKLFIEGVEYIFISREKAESKIAPNHIEYYFSPVYAKNKPLVVDFRNDEDFKAWLKNKKYAKGGGIEDEYFMSQARTSARESIDWEEELRNYTGDNYKSLTAKEKEEIIAEMKENYDYHYSYAKGGLVVTSIKDIPNFKEENEAGRITYRGLGMGKLSNDFYKIAGEGGFRIKVNGKEYYITRTEFNTFSRDSSGKMRIKFDAPFRKFADGGSINKIQDLFPEEKMIKLLKSIKFKQFDSSEIKKAEYTAETYNPFDKNFYAKIRLYPCLITIDQVDNNSYEVRIGEDSGWIGGISYGSWEYVFEISNVNYAEFEKGLKKAVADKTIVLYNTWTSGGVQNFYFVGSLEEAKKFAKENGYEYKRSYGKPYFYYFHNPTQEKLSRWNDENNLYIGKFTSRQIARGTAQSTKGIKQLEHAQIKKARGGEIFNSEFYKEGGSIDINFAKDTNYIKRENIKLVNYKNGKELYNWDYWDSTNTPDNHNGLYSGLYVAKKPLPNTEPDKQYSMFKKGGKLPKSEWEKLPKSAFYINRWDIASVIVYDKKLGEEIEIPANRIVNGIWFDNERTQMIVDRAKKEGLIPDKTKKTTTFIARFNGKKIELEAKSMFDAEQKALKELKVPKSKKGLLSVMSKQAYERGDFQFN